MYWSGTEDAFLTASLDSSNYKLLLFITWFCLSSWFHSPASLPPLDTPQPYRNVDFNSFEWHFTLELSTRPSNIRYLSHVTVIWESMSEKKQVFLVSQLLLPNKLLQNLIVFGELYTSKRYMHSNAYCSTIYNSQDMKATWNPLTEDWIKKMWYIYMCVCVCVCVCVCIMDYHSVKKIMKYWYLQYQGWT